MEQDTFLFYICEISMITTNVAHEISFSCECQISGKGTVLYIISQFKKHSSQSKLCFCFSAWKGKDHCVNGTAPAVNSAYFVHALKQSKIVPGWT